MDRHAFRYAGWAIRCRSRAGPDRQAYRRPGWCVGGDRQPYPAAVGDSTGSQRWEYVHVWIDDASPIAFSKVMRNEKQRCAVVFLKAGASGGRGTRDATGSPPPHLFERQQFVSEAPNLDAYVEHEIVDGALRSKTLASYFRLGVLNV
jgi:hypothetical protein